MSEEAKSDPGWVKVFEDDDNGPYIRVDFHPERRALRINKSGRVVVVPIERLHSVILDEWDRF